MTDSTDVASNNEDEDEEEEEEAVSGDEDVESGENPDDGEEEDDEEEGDEGDSESGAKPKQQGNGKSAASAKVAASSYLDPNVTPVLAVRPRPKKPKDFEAKSLRVTQQKRIGRAWGGDSGPRIDLAHLAYVQEDFARRQEAVVQLRVRMAAKSRPGYQMRAQRRRDLPALCAMVLRRHFAWLPCVKATMSDAVWDGDILQAHSLLQLSSDAANFCDPRTGQRALNLAIQQQQEPIVRLLLDRGADLNAGDDGGLELAPLHNALLMGNKALVRRLLKAGADVEVQDADGFTPLLWAAARGYLELVAQFVERHGARLDHQDVLGWTALHIACFQGYNDVVDYLLLERRVRVDIEDVHGFTPAMFARIADHADIVRKLDAYAAQSPPEPRTRGASMKQEKKKKTTTTKKKKKPIESMVNVESPKKMFVTRAN